MKKKKLYLIDFDGTITKDDSLLHFLNYSLTYLEKIKISILFTPIFILNKLRIITNSKSKELLTTLSFQSKNEKWFQNIAHEFSHKMLPKLIRDSFLLFNSKLENDCEKVIVSASFKDYLLPWCNENGFGLLCTELESKNGLITGKFSTPNCNGQEKVNRILSRYNVEDYEEVHVFGNSKGDYPMLELATKKYYRFFD